MVNSDRLLVKLPQRVRFGDYEADLFRGSPGRIAYRPLPRSILAPLPVSKRRPVFQLAASGSGHVKQWSERMRWMPQLNSISSAKVRAGHRKMATQPEAREFQSDMQDSAALTRRYNL